MKWISRWFGGRKSGSEDHANAGEHAESSAGISSHDPAPVFDPRHPAARAIAAAEAAGQRVFHIQAGRRQITEYTTADCGAVLENIEEACRLVPTDVDLLYAKACAQQLCLRGEDAAQNMAEVLRLAPAHFDASMRQQHSASWDTPFFFTGWDETKKEISELMAGHLSEGHSVQIVRDHLRAAVAVVLPEGGNIRLAGNPRMRWELKWEATPYGKLAAHYLLLDNGNFQEGFLPQLAGEKADPRSGYWILRRLAREKHCFLVVVNGRQVVRNERFHFSPALVTVLGRMGADLEQSGPCRSLSVVEQASQWYMNNSDVSALKY